MGRFSSGSSWDIYAQKITSNGAVSWTANGIAICTAANDQQSPKICSDGAGGAIITWENYRSGDSDIYTQKINSSGVIQWDTNGTAICTIVYNQHSPQIYSDDAGNAIITWIDNRSGNLFSEDIYAQKINSSGAVQWATNGVAICTATGKQWFPQICSDGAGGAIITWEDGRGSSLDIYAQKINSSGVVQWADNGIAMCMEAGNQEYPQICSDSAGGAIITWEDYRNGYSDNYAQKINSSGVIQWTANGIAVCTEVNHQSSPQICSDSTGDTIITWEDSRSGYNDIYAQKINTSGDTQWTANGTAICTLADDQLRPEICSDGSGSAIITWMDHRSGSNYDIYAQKIVSNLAPPSCNHPNYILTPKNGIETINWVLHDDIRPGQYRVWVNDTNNNYYVWKGWNSWTNDSSLNIQVNRTITGIFNYTIEYYDYSGQFGVPDTVLVNVTNASQQFEENILLYLVLLESKVEGGVTGFMLPPVGFVIIGVIIAILVASVLIAKKRSHKKRI